MIGNVLGSTSTTYPTFSCYKFFIFFFIQFSRTFFVIFFHLSIFPQILNIMTLYHYDSCKTAFATFSRDLVKFKKIYACQNGHLLLIFVRFENADFEHQKMTKKCEHIENQKKCVFPW